MQLILESYSFLVESIAHVLTVSYVGGLALLIVESAYVLLPLAVFLQVQCVINQYMLVVNVVNMHTITASCFVHDEISQVCFVFVLFLFFSFQQVFYRARS